MPTASQHRTLIRLLALLLPAAVLVPLVLAAGTGTANAADGYRYWNYFHVESGRYVFATTGPADHNPRDGDVEAYRYGLSTAADGIRPRTAAGTYTVDDICQGRLAATGEKRVGVLIDYGAPSDSSGGASPPEPRAACAIVPTNATGQRVLDEVAEVRVEKQLTCGIDGYPVRGCSQTVPDAPAPAREKSVDFALPAEPSATAASDDPAAADPGSGPEDGGVPWPLIGVLVALVAIGSAAIAVGRRGDTT